MKIDYGGMNERTRRGTRLFTLLAGLACAALGAFVLGAWIWTEPSGSLAGGLLRMRAHTAVSLIASGVALLLLRTAAGRVRMWVGVGLAVFVAVAGLVALMGYDLAAATSLTDLGTDDVVFAGRPGPSTAAGFAMAGVALVLLPWFPSLVVQALALGMGFLGFVALVGHLYAVPSLYSLGGREAVAPHTAFTFVVLAAAVLLARPDRGFARRLLSEAASGVAGRVLLLTTAGPLAAGFLAVSMNRMGIHPAAGQVLVVSAMVFGGIWLALRTAGERELAASERALRRALIDTETRHERMLERLPTGVFRTDTRGRVTFANPAAATFLGFESPEALTASDVDLRKLGVAAEGRGSLIQRLVAEGSVRGAEVEFTLRGGERRSALISLNLLPGPDGPTGAEGTIEDITVRRQAERMKEQFLGVVSHEIRDPLSLVQTAVRMLEASGEITSESGREILDVARRNTERLHRLVGDILDAERMKTGNLTLAPEAVPVQRILAEVSQLLWPKALEARQSIRCDADASLVMADPGRVLQVLSNLVTNAIKFSPADTEVLVTARRDGPSVRFTVQDHGRGIPPDRLPWIWEPFEQAHEDSARLGGVGLGLAICRRIVEGHGGRITAESRAGEGTTFTFWLPAVARGDVLPDLGADALPHDVSLTPR